VQATLLSAKGVVHEEEAREQSQAHVELLITHGEVHVPGHALTMYGASKSKLLVNSSNRNSDDTRRASMASGARVGG
jgi:hypothetical protein